MPPHVEFAEDASSVVLGLAQEGIAFSVHERDGRGVPTEVVVSVRDAGLHAEKPVVSHYASGFEDLVVFVESMEQDWRGWRGQRRYESLEGDLALTAEHDGHVRLTVELCEHIGWHVQADFTLEPGEQMAKSARQLRELLGG